MIRNTCIYDQAGTTTFRRASYGIVMNYVTKAKKGTNLQNIEKSMRRIYIPDEGKIFVQTDQSGAEALVVAYLCRNAAFRSLFLNGVKPHVFVALHLFSDVWQQKMNEYSGDIKFEVKELINCEITNLRLHPFWKQLDKLIKSSDNWPAQQRYYYISKQVCHSHSYDISPGAFQINVLEKSKGTIVLSKQQAQDYGTFYYSLFPEIKEWHKEVREQLQATRTLYNLFGFPRHFGGELSERMFKEAYAFIPQSTVGCITAKAIARMQQYIEENNLSWDNLADTHDSMLTQCPIGEEIECAKKQREFINQTFNYRGETFSMKSESSVGFNWAPAKEPPKEANVNDPEIIEKYNLNGLKELK